MKNMEMKERQRYPISGDLTIDMIADEDMVVTISHNGYIKRRQQRHGKHKIAAEKE